MAETIAVCGSPGSGKTVTALKLAKHIYESNKGTKTVIFVSPDMTTPTLGFLFPNSKDVEMYSLGVALDKTDIFKEDIIRQFVTTKTMKNFSFLGFKLCENKYSYPEPTEGKIVQFFSALESIAEYIIVDCTSDENDLISNIAKRDCDIAVQIFNPDMKSMVYYASCVNQFLMIEGKKIKVLNVMDNDIFLPIEETKSKCRGISFVIPYSRALKQQMITGTLSESMHDSKYMKAVEDIAKAVTVCSAAVKTD